MSFYERVYCTCLTIYVYTCICDILSFTCFVLLIVTNKTQNKRMRIFMYNHVLINVYQLILNSVLKIARHASCMFFLF